MRAPPGHRCGATRPSRKPGVCHAIRSQPLRHPAADGDLPRVPRLGDRAFLPLESDVVPRDARMAEPAAHPALRAAPVEKLHLPIYLNMTR